MEDIFNNKNASNDSGPEDTGSIIFDSKNLKKYSSKKGVKTVDNNPSAGKAKNEPAVEKIGEDENVIGDTLLTGIITSPIWLSVSEAAKLGGVQNKTIRRAIQSKTLKYKIVSNRYLVDMASLIIYLHTKTKLKNKFNQFGLGQYVKEWLE